MNPKERTVLIFLAAAFAVGAAVSHVRRNRVLARATSSPVTVENAVDTTEAPDLKIDLNQAKAYELEALPGIGPKIAQRIIDFRERHQGFRAVSQLREVSGIGPKRYAAIKDLVTVGPED